MSAVPEKIARRSPLYGESGYLRRDHDFYATPDWVTDALLDRVPLRGAVWEPACGDGRMARRIADHRSSYTVIASDIRADAAGSFAADFLTCAMPGHAPLGIDWTPTVRSIVTNPPYTVATDFVRRAVELAEVRDGVVAMLLNNAWDTRAARRDLVARLTRKIILTERIRWIEGSTGNPRQNHAWYVWDFGMQGHCVLQWAP